MAQKLRKKWNMKVKDIPLLIGAIGTTLIQLRNWLKEIGIGTQIIELQQTPPTHCLNPLRGSSGLRILLVTGTQEHKSIVRTVCYILS